MQPGVASRIYSPVLKGRFVFLSASFPSSQRHPDYFTTARPFEITDAVIAVARAVFGATGRLIFGGHPTISPLVLSVGRDFLDEFPTEYRPFVRIYQSKYFEAEIPEETRKLEEEGIGEIVLTPALENDREKSLLDMRTRMLEARPIAGILVGGMEGVYEVGSSASEYALFKKLCPDQPIYPLGHVGGASQVLLTRLIGQQEPVVWKYSQISLEDLQQPTPYPALMSKIVSDIAAQI